MQLRATKAAACPAQTAFLVMSGVLHGVFVSLRAVCLDGKESTAHVYAMRNQFKVLWSNACGCAAQVIPFQALWRSPDQEVVSKHSSAIRIEVPVTEAMAGAAPKPAGSDGGLNHWPVFVDFRPESLGSGGEDFPVAQWTEQGVAVLPPTRVVGSAPATTIRGLVTVFNRADLTVTLWGHLKPILSGVMGRAVSAAPSPYFTPKEVS